MAALTVDYRDLAVFLGTDVDTERATMVLQLAVQACGTIVTVTDTAKFVVLGVAARVYANPVPSGTQVAGPFSSSGSVGGVSLTRAEERQLRRLAGGGGAFTIETCPDTAGLGLPWWDVNVGPAIDSSGFDDDGAFWWDS